MAYEMESSAVADSEVINLELDEYGNLSWNSTAFQFNVYRGLLIDLGYQYFGSCFVSGLYSSAFADPDVPPEGHGFFYVVSGEDIAGEEGTLGFGSCAELSNFQSCP